MMVGAHAYDLRGASKVYGSHLQIYYSELIYFRGIKTVYIQRSTEDGDEDMQQVRKDVDFFLDGRNGTHECGLAELANILGA